MGRFTDIERAAELQAAKTALEAWRAQTRQAKQTAYRNSLNGGILVTQRVAGYIKPFGLATTNNVALSCRILGNGTPSLNGDPAGGLTQETAADMVTVVLAAIGTRARLTMGATDNTNWVATPGKKFKFAKINIKSIGGTRTTKLSRFTNIGYASYPSQSITAPFGQTPAAAETFEAASATMKDVQALKDWLAATATTRSLKFTPQLTSLT